MALFLTLSLFVFLFTLGATDNSELMFSFMVHRHGDRTPKKKHVNFSTNPEEFEKLIKPYGYGQLTKIGMQRAYRLGKFIRSRYHNLLEPKYNCTNVYLQTTDITRTKMTMLVALAAIYPPVDVNKWNETLDWTPVPYTTLPVETDYNRPCAACPNYKHLLKKLYEEKFEEMKPYNDVLELVFKETGIDFDLRDKPLFICDFYNTFESQVSLGLNLTSRLQEALSKIKEAANTAFSIIYKAHNRSLLEFTSGVLLNDFINAANLVVAGDETQKMRIYSTHHQNVYAFSKITRTDISGMPPFASAFSLDLRRETDTNKLYVEPIFAHDMNGSGFAFKTLEVEDCGTPCYYSQFLDLVRDYAWDYDTWKAKCDNNKHTDTWETNGLELVGECLKPN